MNGDRVDWDAATVSAALEHMLDSTKLLSHLDSVERAVIRRAADLCAKKPESERA